ncbi:unnamed protein product [Paramecium sonneborni]|uniref:Uncharacterized protein n=1 Tax=Paramecium sonneborni TaxID=65129 RepID=A0A8S1QAM0_9CILI|nr:unnamed protein product [Paramecium sonneborni]
MNQVIQKNQYCINVISKQKEYKLYVNIPAPQERRLKMKEEKDWKKVIQIFVINQRLTLQNLKIKNKVLNQQFSDALNQLLYPFEQELLNIIKQKKLSSGIVRDLNEQNMLSSIQNERIELPFALNQLSFENCTIQDDVLSGFLVICELKDLSIINCKEFQVGIKRSMELIKRLQLDEYYSYKIKSFSCENTVIQDVETFQSLIKDIVLNSNRQLLEILNLDNCSLNDDMMLVLSKQLMAIKEEQKKYNRVFLLRDLNLSNNNQMSVNSWQQLWDVLLNESKLEKKVDVPQEQSIIIANPSVLLRTFEKEKDTIINETQKLIESSLLCLKQKTLYNYQKFTPQFPKQITSLIIKMEFKNLNDNELKFQYYRLILKNLELESLNMIAFIKACLEAYEYSKFYLESALKQSKQDHKSQIKSIKIKSLTANDEESTEKFIQIFLCSKHIELNVLNIFGCTQPILHLILKNIDRKEDYKLEELSLPHLEETLDLEDTINYCQWIVFGEKMPIKKLTCCPNLSEINQEKFDQFSLSKIKVESISLKQKQDNSSSVIQYSMILFKLFLNGLQEITIDKTDATSIIVNTFNKINDFDNLMLKKLTFKGDLKINKNLFEKLSKLFEKLELFQVQKLLLENEFEIYDICSLMDINQSKNLKIIIKQVTCNNPNEFYKKFLFNPNVGITEVILKDPSLLENKFDIYDLGQKIRYLNLQMGLLYNSHNQLNVNALQIISKMLIYNESSNLEELVLHQCHFKIEGIQALCKYSSTLREKIKNEGRDQTAQLKLKKATLYYSLYIGDDGVQIYCNDLLYFEYISIERFEVQVTNWNDQLKIGCNTKNSIKDNIEQNTQQNIQIQEEMNLLKNKKRGLIFQRHLCLLITLLIQKH